MRWIGDNATNLDRSSLRFPEDALIGRFIYSLPDVESRRVVRVSMEDVMADWKRHPLSDDTAIVVHRLKREKDYREAAERLIHA